MKKNSIIIYGCGGHGKVVLDILLEAKENVLGFIDDDLKKKGKKINGFPVLGNWSVLTQNKSAKVALGIGNNDVRKNIYEKASREGVGIASAIHPKSVISRFAKIGKGVVIMAGAVINPSVTIEDGVVVNTGATVDHDCHLKRFCHIWPGAHLAGTVSVGECSYIGTGAAVIQNINIGNCAMIGAGSVVIADVPDHVTVAGVPTRILKKDKTCATKA